MKLTDLTTLIEAAAIATAGVDLFAMRLPETPAAATVVRSYGGRPREQTHTGSVRRFPRVQVVSRDVNPATAFDTAERIYQLFQSTRGWTDAELLVDGTQYEVIVPLGDLFPLTHDTSGRFLYAANYELRVAE